MSNEFIKIHYNSNTKIWKSINYPYKDLSNRSLGEAFLQSMRSLEPSKVLEYHYDVRREKQAKDIYQESILVAKNLVRLGIGKGDVILLFSGYNYFTSILTFGALLMGAIVNYFEVQLDNEDIDDMFAVLEPSVIFYEEIFHDKIIKSLKRQKPKTLQHVISIDNPNEPNVTSELLKSSSPLDFDNFKSVQVEYPEKEVAFLVLTSGTTGLPKATQLTHCLLLNSVYIWWDNPFRDEPLNDNSILISLSPLRWISQVILCLESAILGIKRICANRAATGTYGLEILRETQPSHMFAVPSFFYEVLLELKEDDVESLNSLKYIELAGEHPSRLIKNLTKKHAVNSKLFFGYGMSETACNISNDENISGGKLLPGYEMQILDENFQPLGPNQRGQVAIKTPYPYVGYKGLDNTKYILENGFYLNGDYGYFDDENTFHMLSRYKDLIRYENILLVPNIVESLALKIPEIYQARLVGYHRLPDDIYEVAALFVVLEHDVTLTRKEVALKIRETWKGELSDDEIFLIHDIYILDSFPLTTCGKIDRLALVERAILMADLSNE